MRSGLGLQAAASASFTEATELREKRTTRWILNRQKQAPLARPGEEFHRTDHVRPAVPTYREQDAEGDRWKVIPVVEELKAKAKSRASGTLHAAAQRRPPPCRGKLRVRRSRPDQPRICALRRGNGPHRLRVRGLQLLRARHRQHGSLPPLRHARAEGRVADPADERRNPFRLPDDRTLHRQFRRDEYRDPDRTRRRRICHQRPQMVVLGPRRSALQGRDRHGQDRFPPVAMRSNR